ncbi:hypothetical protein [Sphingomonas xinjiangensis]|uniref:Uncharacterized protein n=1 Tax=Sphingomonas xinjiangensis TaxID=643568 RepID=A0A840YQZ3_9SPHN|nr:hypothetical protein [Sphingomonas xinjiangensis]MBB5711532.1 hypothetical protein [Sphingomonas xinjiangensis]
MNVQTAITTGLAGRTRRGIIAVLLAQHAITREDAVAFMPRTPAEQREFTRLRATGAIQDAGPNRYWLDRAALHADNEARRRVLIPLAIVLLLVAAIIPLFFYKDVPSISITGTSR